MSMYHATDVTRPPYATQLTGSNQPHSTPPSKVLPCCCTLEHVYFLLCSAVCTAPCVWGTVRASTIGSGIKGMFRDRLGAG